MTDGICKRSTHRVAGRGRHCMQRQTKCRYRHRRQDHMSALGHKQTFCDAEAMSALPPKADICSAKRHVRFVPKADIARPNAEWYSWPTTQSMSL